MKPLRFFIFLLSGCFIGCEETIDSPVEYFTIKKGEHYSTYKAELLQADPLMFYTTFDETAEYHLEDEVNQWDTNKLFGFSDCNSQHHENSARFGWRWIDGKIDIIAYCYTSGVRTIEKIGETSPNIRDYYEIGLTDTEYVFKFNSTEYRVPRNKPCDKGAYYLLFPFFGGNDVAPHDIHITIERVY